jgi:predicted dehydrogenase
MRWRNVPEDFYTMTDTIRVGVVGVGHLGKHHARIYSENPRCELTAIADVDEDRAKHLAKQYGAKAFAKASDLYDRVDAVSIAVPTSLHHEVASGFLSHGIHCLVEKPITKTVAEAEELIRLADENRCVLQVGHIERYNAAIRKLLEFLDRPAFIECHRLGPFTPRVADVGVVLDLMIHDIDIVLQIVRSPIVSMDAVGVDILTDKEDIANVRLKFANGCTANLTVSRVSPKPQRKIRIFQKDMYVSIDYAKQSMELYKKVARPNARQGEAKADIVRRRLRVKKEDMLTLELDDFLTTIFEGRQPNVTGENARDALRLAVDIAREIASKDLERTFS